MVCVDIYPDGVHITGNPLMHGGGVFLEIGLFTRLIWPFRESRRPIHGFKIMFSEATAALQGLLSALRINGRGNLRIHVDNASVVQVYKLSMYV